MRIKEINEVMSYREFKYVTIHSTPSLRLHEQHTDGRLVAYEAGRRKYARPAPGFIKSHEDYDLVEKRWGDEMCGIFFKTFRTYTKAKEYYDSLVEVDAKKG